MYKPFIPLVASFFAVSLISSSALADESDFDLPIKVDAKSQFIDGKNKISIFKDDVNITQGSLVIDADEVEVIASAGEGKEVFIARGRPASYQQQMEDGSIVKATANTIQYEVLSRMISLDGNAELQQNTSVVTGDSISYDMNKEQLLAEGDEKTEGRVTAVFRPESLKELADDKEQDKEEQKNEDKP